MQRHPPTPQEVKRRVGRLLVLLYVGYVGLAIYLYVLIRGSILAYVLGCFGVGLLMWMAFRLYFRRVQ
jgi:hypothetical protein